MAKKKDKRLTRRGTGAPPTWQANHFRELRDKSHVYRLYYVDEKNIQHFRGYIREFEDGLTEHIGGPHGVNREFSQRARVGASMIDKHGTSQHTLDGPCKKCGVDHLAVRKPITMEDTSSIRSRMISMAW